MSELKTYIVKSSGLVAAAERAAHWMQWWLDEHECDCDGMGHQCGRPQLQRELEELQHEIQRNKEE